jgi:O-methyltransferase
MFSPIQIVFLAEEAKKAMSLQGSYVEIGCAYGETTLFLAKYLQQLGCEQAYYAIDTFSGFVREHIDHEVSARGKKRSRLSGAFSTNDPSWLKRSLEANGVRNVRITHSDATKVDYSALGPIGFCLLDVDLYNPVRDTLPRIYDALAPNGVIIVDDCKPDVLFDGARQAYLEFCETRQIAAHIVHEKLGVLYAPAPRGG